MDLVPIGCNPATGYWEFYHLPSAWDRSSDPGAISIPEHRADGSIEVTGTTGIVFVLLPGGDVSLGSQRDDASAPYYVAGGDPNEQLHAVNLPPFFLARHEVTQAQWARLWGWDPAKARPSRYSANNTVAGQDILLTNPVEMVDWTMCATLAHRHGLTLPAEAQWEYACRGGTTTPFQVEMARLREFANVADATAKQAYRDWVCDTWTDGFVVHAPVGSFAPNAFGLFDMHGNVWEWCDDWYGPYTESQVEDGLSADADSRYRCYRGGGARKTATYTRSARRDYEAPTFRNATLGLRLARELHPGE
jgi:formylglycine-generating enzyme required for sulfatase activity